MCARAARTRASAEFGEDLSRERGAITMLPEDTYLDEVIGWSVAVFGVWSQLAAGA